MALKSEEWKVCVYSSINENLCKGIALQKYTFINELIEIKYCQILHTGPSLDIDPSPVRPHRSLHLSTQVCLLIHSLRQRSLKSRSSVYDVTVCQTK